MTAEKVNASAVMMLMDMDTARREKNSKMSISIIKRWFPLTDLTAETIIGSFAWTSLVLKQKWILQKNAVLTTGGWVTPSDIARDYLNLKFPTRNYRLVSAQYQECVKKQRSQPLLAEPQIIDHACYIDLKSAYWSILRVVGWDVDYFPDNWLMVRSDVEDFPYPENKLARNCLVTAGMVGDMKIWNGKKLVFVKKGNRLVNYVLWTLIQDVLHGVAKEIAPMAAYINTDGYIVDAKHREEVFSIIESWGLPCSVKFEGRAIIYRVGQYNIEGKNWVDFKPGKAGSVYKINDINVPFLKKRFAKFAKKRRKKELTD